MSKEKKIIVHNGRNKSRPLNYKKNINDSNITESTIIYNDGIEDDDLNLKEYKINNYFGKNNKSKIKEKISILEKKNEKINQFSKIYNEIQMYSSNKLNKKKFLNHSIRDIEEEKKEKMLLMII